ncbi:MAG: phosphoribosylamine--glycine ligase, partial [Leptospiraceae bacterium]|nr:phosphoribosylamine--glycine ligase [Leptospiraceae bacterium]
EEVSVIALCDGERGLLLASSQDHKRALDGDRGLNTGGMGAYSPAPVLTEALERTVVQRVVQPTLDGMAAEGRACRGVLYVGLMMVDGEPHVLEYNCRFGDPETQALMVRLRSDLAQLSMEVARGQLETTTLEWDARASICVVMAADGYPGHYETGHVIEGVDVASA